MVVFVQKGMLLEFTSQCACAHSLTFNSFQPHGLQATCQALCPELSLASIPEWAAIPFSRGSSQPSGQTLLPDW